LHYHGCDGLLFKTFGWGRKFLLVRSCQSGSIAVAEGPVKATGGSYKSIFTANPTTVHVVLDDAISTTGALVWDWNGMRLVGVVPHGPAPEVTLNTGQNESHFLGITPRTGAVQSVALSGGLLGPVLDNTMGHRLAVGVYRATPGQPVTLAIYRGGWSVKRVSASGTTVTDVQFDPDGAPDSRTCSGLLCHVPNKWGLQYLDYTMHGCANGSTSCLPTRYSTCSSAPRPPPGDPSRFAQHSR